MESEGREVKEEGCDGVIKEAEMLADRKTGMAEPGRTVRRVLLRRSMEERGRRQLWKAKDSGELGGIIRSNKERETQHWGV